MFLFVILYFVFVKFLKVGSDMPHWPVALLTGIVLWNFFLEITSAGVGSIVGRGDVIRKINFPKYIIVLSSSISALINLGLNMLVLFFFIFLARVSLSWEVLLAPIYMIEIFVFGLGLAFVLSATFVRYRDINFIWEIILQGLFYASIVLYPVSLLLQHSHPAVTKTLMMNPVAQAIQGLRHVLISDKYPTVITMYGVRAALIPTAIVVGTFVLGAWYFKRRSQYFAEDI